MRIIEDYVLISMAYRIMVELLLHTVDSSLCVTPFPEAYLICCVRQHSMTSIGLCGGYLRMGIEERFSTVV